MEIKRIKNNIKEYLLILIALVAIVFCLVEKMYWLSGIIIAIAGMVYLLYCFNKLSNKLLRRLSYYPVLVVFIFTVIVVIKLFFVEIFHIPTDSMEGSINPGDRIIANKLEYGVRLPNSPFEIPWVNLAFYLNKSAREKMGQPWWQSKRLKGYSEVEQNDVIIFKSPQYNKITLIKRCVALPGDTVEIVNDSLYVNSIYLKNDKVTNYRRVIYTSNSNAVDSILNEKELFYYHYMFNTAYGIVVQGKLSDISQINTYPFVDSVISFPNNDSIFHNSSRFNWTKSNYGEVVIPKACMKIKLNSRNIELYGKTIEQFENVSSISSDTTAYYTFKNNYYWCMGDNRDNSYDSRFLGFIPESHIVAKACLVLYSHHESKMNRGRFLKKIE